ncbi:hypothetical protein CHH28_10370 [Bacterioplanes sanyensis]|uniref:HD domain-containing protein n=1 Tax=Bacterioplanes sanyensis TaxID=1249553 RepID=A0A222FJ84_9GAMM|nr:AAA family ATPase [Bacterioplanes sanyensis]ASP39058.1 hypothetical protein CHH28_10370 [Bacterioplanes sanyensis]
MSRLNAQQQRLSQWFERLADGQHTNLLEAIEVLSDDLPWLRRLADTPQDPQWHAEGNVFIHTQMVLDELYKILPTKAFTREETLLLVLAVILHDIAKPEATRNKEINGIDRVVASGHEELGMAYLAPRVAHWPLPHRVKKHLLGLVGAHQKPKLLVVKDCARHDYFNLARQAPLHLFYYLELADMRGRICDDLSAQVELLELFKLYAKDFGFWRSDVEDVWLKQAEQALPMHNDKAKNYLSQHSLLCFSQGKISQAEEGIAMGFGQRDSHGHLEILVGISGSGKSSWISKHRADCQAISLDELRQEINGDRQDQSNFGSIIREAKKRLKAALANGQHVIWDATSLRLDFRTPLVDIALAYKAKVSLICFWVPLQQLQQQNASRQYSVPNEVLQKQLYSWQWPLPSEAHELIYVDGDGETLP